MTDQTDGQKIADDANAHANASQPADGGKPTSPPSQPDQSGEPIPAADAGTATDGDASGASE